MDPTLIDLSAKSGQFISANSDIPPDIIFKFADKTEIAAHKMILSMVSLVFRNMFYVHDTRDRLANEIVIEGTTKPPFQIMIDSVYNIKSMKKSLQEKSVDEIFAVLHLVTMYEIPELVLAVKEYLSTFPITEENVMEVADNAMEYLSTFEEAAQCLLLSCAKILKRKLTDTESFNQFVVENGDKMATVHKLAVLMKGLPPIPMSTPVCCSGYECMDGVDVCAENVKVGIRVIRDPKYNVEYRSHESQGVGVIVKKDVRKENCWFIRWENGEENGKWAIESRHNAIFLFKCR